MKRRLMEVEEELKEVAVLGGECRGAVWLGLGEGASGVRRPVMSWIVERRRCERE
jgi:hypothetical protein